MIDINEWEDYAASNRKLKTVISLIDEAPHQTQYKPSVWLQLIKTGAETWVRRGLLNREDSHYAQLLVGLCAKD